MGHRPDGCDADDLFERRRPQGALRARSGRLGRLPSGDVDLVAPAPPAVLANGPYPHSDNGSVSRRAIPDRRASAMVDTRRRECPRCRPCGALHARSACPHPGKRVPWPPHRLRSMGAGRHGYHYRRAHSPLRQRGPETTAPAGAGGHHAALSEHDHEHGHRPRAVTVLVGAEDVVAGAADGGAARIRVAAGSRVVVRYRGLHIHAVFDPMTPTRGGGPLGR